MVSPDASWEFIAFSAFASHFCSTVGSLLAARLAFWSHCFSTWTSKGERGFPLGFCGRFPSWLRALS
eukprot:scaffold98357_cov72-Phaeocystis_antarctica.AAC.1